MRDPEDLSWAAVLPASYWSRFRFQPRVHAARFRLLVPALAAASAVAAFWLVGPSPRFPEPPLEVVENLEFLERLDLLENLPALEKLP